MPASVGTPFTPLGCRVSDHGLEHCYRQPADAADARIFDALCK